jgi:hypothetical protein
MKIRRPSITQVANAPIGSTLEMWRNKNVETPEVWVKTDCFMWENISIPDVLPRRNNGLELSTKYQVILHITEMKG